MSAVVGVDIGGTGIKVAPVDIDKGIVLERPRTKPTPEPALPGHVVEVVASLVGDAVSGGSVGVGFPGVVRDGVAETAANLDPSWVGVDVVDLLGRQLPGSRLTVINDADAAGLAEVHFGAGADRDGVIVMVTLGTGIGTGVFVDGVLVPNTEFGHLEVDGIEAEDMASGRARNREGVTWEIWADHLEDFLRNLERLLWPDLYIIGGGISDEFRRFCSNLDNDTPVIPAVLGNEAGIVGAAMAAQGDLRRDRGA